MIKEEELEENEGFEVGDLVHGEEVEKVVGVGDGDEKKEENKDSTQIETAGNSDNIADPSDSGIRKPQ